MTDSFTFTLTVLVSLCSKVLPNDNAILIPTSTPWQQAHESCQLIGNKGAQSFSTTRFPNDTGQTEAWAGSYKVYTAWISLIGCYHVQTSTLMLWRNISYDPNDVGRCVEFCNNFSYYGLSRNHCFCAPILPVATITCVETLCPSTSDYCGGPLVVGADTTSQVVFYRREADLALSRATGQYCMSSTQYTGLNGGYTYQTQSRSCTDVLRYFACRSGEGQYTLYSYSPVTWSQAVAACRTYGYGVLANKAVFEPPISYRIDNGTEFWVGIMRREFMTYGTELPLSHTNAAYQCMALSIGEDGTPRQHLHTCSDRLPAWCEESNTFVYSTRPNTGRTSSNVTPDMIPRSPVNADAALTTAAMVGIIVSIGITIVVVVVVLLLRKKMKRRIYVGTPNLPFIPADSLAIAEANYKHIESKKNKAETLQRQHSPPRKPNKEEKSANKIINDNQTSTVVLQPSNLLDSEKSNGSENKIYDETYDTCHHDSEEKTPAPSNVYNSVHYGSQQYDILQRDYKFQEERDGTGTDYDHIEMYGCTQSNHLTLNIYN